MARARRPPPVPSRVSEYDGHEDYRQRLDDNPLRLRFRHYVGAVLALAIAVTATTFIYPAVGIVGAPVVGLIAFIVYVVALAKTERRSSSARLAVIVAGIGFVGFAAFYPFGIDSLSLDARARAAAAAAREQAEQAADRVARRRAGQELARTDPAPRERWLAQLHALGRFGPPSATPPMLDVVAEGDGEEIINRSRDTLLVSVTRVLRDPAAAGGWRGCALYADTWSKPYAYELQPWDRVFFLLPESCGDEFRSADSEYRIGDDSSPPELGWWSVSAFAAPLGREFEDGAGDSIEPQTYDAADWFRGFATN